MRNVETPYFWLKPLLTLFLTTISTASKIVIFYSYMWQMNKIENSIERPSFPGSKEYLYRCSTFEYVSSAGNFPESVKP